LQRLEEKTDPAGYASSASRVYSSAASPAPSAHVSQFFVQVARANLDDTDRRRRSHSRL